MGSVYSKKMDDPSDSGERIEAARKEAEELKEQIEENREAKNDESLSKLAADLAPLYRSIKLQRTLTGHDGKIYSFHWSQESPTRLVSAGQDGNLIVWDGITTNKIFNVSLRSNWVFACAYCPTAPFVASGGLDNTCSVFHLKEENPSIKKPVVELKGHDGYISFCRFIDGTELLTASGDKTAALWDVERSEQKTVFRGHSENVLSLALNTGAKKNAFLTSSIDKTVRLWDIRSGECERVFKKVHTSDINSVVYFPSGDAFASGSEDSSIKLYDIRADRTLSTMKPEVASSCASVAFSLSGRFVFGGFENGEVHAFDVLTGNSLQRLPKVHTSNCTCIGFSADGFALGTAGWDRKLTIQA